MLMCRKGKLGRFILCASLLHGAASLSLGAPQESGQSGNVNVHDAQNPVSSVISIPFQNNTYFNTGPYERTGNALVVEPVIPFKLTPEWNLITRWITPVIYLPRLSPVDGSKFGLGNLQPEFYLSPSHPGKVIWGLGPKLYLPTATDSLFGLNKWGGGPAAALLTIQGPWVFGILANNVWAGTENRRVNQMTLDPFVNYNMPRGWYLVSSLVMTSDWLAKPDERWTVPIGGGVGRLFKIGNQPINARIQALYNVVRPDYAPDWQLQLQVQFLFPIKK